MNRLIGYYFLLVLFICTFSFVKVSSYNLPLRNKIIYIDPGHGGTDSGAIYKDIYEKDINLDISYEIKIALENKGATVYMTRYDDYDLSVIGASLRKKSDLSNRVKLINESNADMYLSIHLNSIESSKWKGIQLFYDDVNSENIKIAQYINNEVEGSREIAVIKNKYMYKRVSVPGVLIELGFLSNNEDRNNLLNGNKRKEMIEKIVEGIINYYNE